MRRDRGAAERATYVIGITGGIGAGKTLVTEHLRARGFRIIDADEVSREMSEPGEPLFTALTDEFGGGIVGLCGQLDRAALAGMAFSDDEKLARLNRVSRGIILAGLRDLLLTASGTVFLSAPLLFESGLDKECDEVWFIAASEELRARRAAKRDGGTEEEVRKRMRAQLPEEQKREMANRGFPNEAAPEHLLELIDEAVSAISPHPFAEPSSADR